MKKSNYSHIDLFALKTLLLLLIFTTGAGTYPEYQGCDNLTDADFQEKKLLTKINHPTLNEPMKLAFDPVYDDQGNMHVNFYFTERRGKIKYYDAQTQQVSIIGELAVTWGTSGGFYRDLGLTGIALDPDFNINNWMYLFYFEETEEFEAEMRLSRFTVVERVMDRASEKIIMKIPWLRQCCHTGGALKFDAYGDLWVSMGQNTQIGSNNMINESEPAKSSERTSSNTMALRGGISRIHPIPFPDTETPEPGIGQTYTIPEGNFGEYWADEFERSGDYALAAEYRDPNKVRPELFAKGMRNPYTLTLDPVRRWATYGDCGPDGQGGATEEHTVVTQPGYFGWPYFAGNNQPVLKSLQESVWGELKDPNMPLNTSKYNTGVERLPPATPATHAYPQQCAMTGPIYRYDPDLDSDVKFPPHFDRKWLITDHNRSWIKSLTLEEDGSTAIANEDVLTHLTFYRPLDMQTGPDGALYISNYSGSYNSNQNTSIVKVEYTGDCLPDRNAFTGTFEKAGCTDENYEEYDPRATHPLPGACATLAVNRPDRPFPGAVITDRDIYITAGGEHSVTLYDLRGEQVRRITGSGIEDYSLEQIRNSHTRQGVHIVTVRTGQGTVSRKMVF